MKRWGVLVCAVMCAVFGLTSSSRAANATFPGTNGQIVYEDLSSLAILGPDGTDLGEIPGLGALPSRPYSPSVSPDGSTVAFWVESCAGGGDIYTVHLDGNDLTQVTSGGCFSDPTWNPAGTQLLVDDASNSE